MSEATGALALALPAETPADVVDLATEFGARRLIVIGDQHAGWPAVVETATPSADCFRELPLTSPAGVNPDILDDVHAYEIVCP